MICNKTIIIMVRRQLKRNSHKSWFVLGLILGMTITFVRTYAYLRYTSGQVIQCMEPFVLLLNDYTYNQMVLLGYLLMITDSPFISGNSLFTIMRSNRREWFRAMLVYLLFLSFFYYGCILIETLVMSAPIGYRENEWSSSFQVLVLYQPEEAFSVWGILVENRNLVRFCTPYMVMIATYLLQALYAGILSIVSFVINLKGRWVLGNAATVIFHLINVLILKSFMSLWIGKYSMFARSMLVQYKINADGIPGLPITLGIYLGIIWGGYVIGRIFVMKTDFQIQKEGRG